MKAAYCLPIIGQGERFAAERHRTVYELPKLSVLQPYLSAHYTQRPNCLIELDGVVYRSTAFVPIDPEDVAYALVDETGIPVEDTATPTAGFLELIRTYWAGFQHKLQFGDSLSSAYPSFLPDEFIPPRFEVVGTTATRNPTTLSWRELQRHARFVVFGQPGSGKTTSLRMLAAAVAAETSRMRNPRLAVYIPLRELREGDTLLSRAARDLNVDPESPAFAHIVDSGRLILLLDGLDEVDSSLGENLLGQITSISGRHKRVGIGLGTREGGYQWRLPGFVHARILPWSRVERYEWIDRRFARVNRQVAEQCKNMLEASPHFGDAVTTPLILNLLAVVFEGSGSLPKNTSDLLLRYVDALVERWDAERGVNRWKERPFDPRLTIRVLCRTAYNSTFHDANRFSARDLSEWESEWTDKVDANAFLEYVWRGSHLLEPSSHDIWTFRSRAVQDVLCAKYLVERTDDILQSTLAGDRAARLIAVWHYACQITQDASPLLEAILRAPDSDDIRAPLVIGVLLDEISIRRQTQKRAENFLRRALRGLSERTTVLDEQISAGRWHVEIGSGPGENSALEACANVFRSFVRNGTATRRETLVSSLAHESGWLAGRAFPAIAERPGLSLHIEATDDRLSITLD